MGQPPASIPSVRRRDAAATRAAILQAAHKRFLGESYDSVGLRDIARDAGVDVALIGRYFGGKEGLFGAVLWPEDRPDFTPPADVQWLPEYLAHLAADEDVGKRDHRMEMFVIMLRSASSPKAGKIIRRLVNEDVLQPMIAILDEEAGAWRANMLLAVLMGIGVLSTVMESDGLTCGVEDRAEHLERYRKLFEAILKA